MIPIKFSLYSQTTIIQVLRFLLVGMIGMILDYVLYRTLIEGGLDLELAKAASAVVVVITLYFMHKYWTFSNSDRSLALPLKFISVYLGSAVVNVSINAWLLSILTPFPFYIEGAFLGAAVISAIYSFIAMRFLVF